MMTRYDEEIRELETRLQREREALADRVDEVAQRARSTADRARASVASPRGLLGALAAGYLIGELTRRRRKLPPHGDHESSSVPRKLGVGGLLGGAALAVIRAQYGSPLAFARAMSEYVAEWRAARAAMAGEFPADPHRVQPRGSLGSPSSPVYGPRWPPP